MKLKSGNKRKRPTPQEQPKRPIGAATDVTVTVGTVKLTLTRREAEELRDVLDRELGGRALFPTTPFPTPPTPTPTPVPWTPDTPQPYVTWCRHQ